MMSETSGSMSTKLKHELVALWWAFLYLFIMFGMLLLYRMLILEQHDINGFKFGVAALNALIFAKVILIGDWLKLGTKSDSRALLWSVLAKSAAFAGLFIVFHFFEDAIIGLFHHKRLLDSLRGDALELNTAMVASVIFAVALIPFFAFREITRAIGPARMQTLLFKPGGVAEVFRAPR